MRIKRFSVILAVLLVAILALGAVSAESIDDANLDLADDSADAVSIDSIDDVSVDTTDKDVKNSLGANIVGNESGTDEGEAEEMANYDIDDYTYSTYFNEDGTPTDKLSVEGNYSLNIGTLTNKDIKIDAGNNILIINKPDEGTIYNGTITIGTGDTAMKSISIAGLAFINENKDAIVINELCSDVSIDSNSLDLTYDNESISNAIAIKTNGYVKNVVISNNQIFMDSVVNYTYGIDIAYYKTWTEYAIANPEAVDLLDNVIEITSSAESGMAEAIYFDTAINSLIDANEITVTTINKDVANYALQVADSWGFYNDPFAFSPSNITISGNEITQNSADMAYGITVISLTDFDEDNAKIEKFFNISDNIVEINSESAAVGIGVKTSYATVEDNLIFISAAEDESSIGSPDPAFGNQSVAIFVNNFDSFMGYYNNIAVTDNTIVANVDDIKVTKTVDEEPEVAPLVIQDNDIVEDYYTISDDSYGDYFNDDGTPNDVLGADGDYVLFIDSITDKNIWIDSGSAIEIRPYGSKGNLINSTIIIGDGEGSAGLLSISGLTFTNENRNPLIVNDLSTSIEISENEFVLNYDSTFTGSAMAIVTYGYVYGIDITDNDIWMESEVGYTYGIDITVNRADWSYADANPEEITINGNSITIISNASSGMVEAMYLDTITQATVEGNTIHVETTGSVANYGIQVSDGHRYASTPLNSSSGVSIIGNTFELSSNDMAYGITVISLSNEDTESEVLVKDFVISGNKIKISSEKGAIAIGVKTSDVVVIDNTIELLADSDAIIQAYPDPAFGNESIAIFVNNYDNYVGDITHYYNITVTDNDVQSNVLAIKVTEESDDNEPLVIEDNTIEVDVSIKIETDVPAVKIGHDITYTVTVTNDGPNFANDVIVSFDIEGSVILADYPEEYDPDTGIWIVDVAPGTSEELVITATDYIEETINATAKIEDMGEYLTNLATETEDSNQVIAYTIVIDDTNYEEFFDEIGALKNDTQIEAGDTIFLGVLTNKNLIFDIPLTIYPDTLESKLVNTTITIGEGADGTNVSGLVFEFTGDENTGSIAIIYAVGVSDIEISENTIIVTNFVDKTGAKYGSTLYGIEVESGVAGCNNVLIRSNEINIVGSSRYLYGIDVFKTWGSENGNSNVTIDYNVITIDPASRMAEGIYASDIDHAVIEYNIINSIGDAAAYGIGSDSLTDSLIDNNNITATAGTQAYGITNTNSKDVNIINNTVNATGVGAVGIGISGEDTLVEDNTIEITGGDYTSISSSDSLGTANAGILDKGKSNTIGENDITENCPPTITDENYDQYFDENGKILNTSGIEEGDLIFLGELSNKNFVIDVPLVIKGAPGAQAKNTTISLREGADGTSICELDMVYEDDGTTTFAVISVYDGVSEVNILDNTIDITAAPGWNYNMAISVYGSTKGSENISISGNTIIASAACGGFYGIDVQNYDDAWNKGQGTTGLTITDNTITINGTGMVEPIYISSCNDVLVDNNTIASYTDGGDAYAIGTSSNNNLTVTNNTLIVSSKNNMAYAVAVPDSKDVIIDDNTIIATGAGAIGVGLVNDENVEIDGNDITIGGGDYTGVTTYEKVGKANAAIFDKSGNTGVEIGENTISENAPIIVDDSTYGIYFNEDGTIKDDSPIVLGSTILIGELSDKKLVIDTTVTIQPAEKSKLTNTVIELGEGSDGTVVKDLDIEFTGDETTGSVGIIYAHDTSDIVIANNTITVPAFVNKEGSKYGSSVYAIEVESGVDGTDNITIEGNYIEINGTANYLYGIDAFATWGQNTTNSNLTIEDNTIIINGGARMAEAIYVSESEDVTIAGNNVTALSDAAAYGIATDQLDGAEIVDNDVNVEAGTTGYGITATTSGKDVLIESNNIMTQGTSAVGVGLSGQDNVTVKDNEIETLAGDYASVQTADNLGTANAAILDKDNKNTNLVLENNTLTENGKQVNTTHSGNTSAELQALIDAAEPGSTLDLEGVIYSGISDVVIDKDLTITNGTISGKEGETVFVIPAKSEGGPDEVTITGVDFIINNGNTIVKATADNGTTPTSIDTPAITLTNNTVGTLKEDVVRESVTLLELESERGSLAPTSPIKVEGNTLDSGVDPFEFTVTGVADESGNVVIPAGGNIPQRQATVIHYQDMKTSTVNTAIEGRVGKYFEVNLTDANGNPLADKEVKIGFNGKIYNRTTNATGGASLQINLAKVGLYTFAISFLGDDNYNASFEVSKINVTAQKTKLTTSNKSYKASAKTKTLTVTLKSAEYNKALPNKKITVTVNGKSYSAKTNSKGVATVKVSLSAKKTYKFTAKFAGDDRYAAASVTGKVTIK